jgi:hypothetical protein|tara:strand:- start:148 stop:372 length:225 start_codon:yes stop_codon:yes gene_type:complete
MSILTSIDGIPLFSTPQEALDWGSQNNQQGYHTHPHNGVIGYMGGATHAIATGSSNQINTNPTPSITQSTSSGY